MPKIESGIAIPQVFLDGPVDRDLIRKCLEKAEAQSFSSAWVQETIVSPFSILEPVSLLAYAAALTDDLRLGSSVLLTTLRNPVQLAKALSSIDHLCAGRLDVGIGTGGHISESIFGYSTERRIRRFTEGIEVMKLLWEQDRANYEGVFWQFKDIAMEPKPIQRPGPPLWFGARKEPALRRAVRMGDGWMAAGSSTTEDFVETYATLRRILDEEGRDPATFKVSKRVYLAIDSDEKRAETRLRDWFGTRYNNAEMGSKVSIWGDVNRCTEAIGAIVAAGARHLLFNPAFDDLEHMDRINEEILPALDAFA